MNGRGLTFWIMQALYLLLLSGVGLYAASQNERIKKLEDFKDTIALDVNTIKWDVKGARKDLCRMENSFSQLRADVTHTTAFMRDCQ